MLAKNETIQDPDDVAEAEMTDEKIDAVGGREDSSSENLISGMNGTESKKMQTTLSCPFRCREGWWIPLALFLQDM